MGIDLGDGFALESKIFPVISTGIFCGLPYTVPSWCSKSLDNTKLSYILIYTINNYKYIALFSPHVFCTMWNSKTEFKPNIHKQLYQIVGEGLCPTEFVAKHPKIIDMVRRSTIDYHNIYKKIFNIS